MQDGSSLRSLEARHSKLVLEVLSLQFLADFVVFITHNHFIGEIKEKSYVGILPFSRNDLPLWMGPHGLQRFIDPSKCYSLEPLLDRWSSEFTARYVMMKTLQQARTEGIWIPATIWDIRWGDELRWRPMAIKGDLCGILDVGICTLSEGQGKKLNRQR